MSKSDPIEVRCVCGRTAVFPKGYLTQEAERNYKCEVCRQKVVENQAQERAKGDREVLVD